MRAASRVPMRSALVVAVLATALPVALTVPPAMAATTTAKTKICGQVKHGPHAAYTTLVTHKQLSGTTWTVFSTGVPCSLATKTTPAILRWWAKAKVGAYDFSLNGFSCNKEDDGHGKSGTIGCSYSKGPPLANIELMMTGPYSIAQLKQLFFIS
jgi:hypothetical protein